VIPHKGSIFNAQRAMLRSVALRAIDHMSIEDCLHEHFALRIDHQGYRRSLSFKEIPKGL
jgi:hypothetical protein